jgi:hypothetical protein
MEKKNQNQADTSRANQNGHLDLLTTELMDALAIRGHGCVRRGIWRAKRSRMETESGTLWRSPDGARLNLACAATGPLRGRREFGFGC